MAANLDLVIRGVDHTSGVFKDIDNHASKLGNTMGTVLKVGMLGAAAGIGVATFAAIDFLKQAIDEEAGIKRLAAAVDASGGSWAKSGGAIEEVIRQRQKLAFSDDELRSSLALLTAITGDADEALRRQTVAMDFARGANIDLGTASKLLGKVTDETVNVLGRYGIRVQEGADATDVLALVQQKFAGQSAAFADSTAGKWAKFNIALDNIKETIGTALLPVASKLADVLTKFLEEHEDDIQRLSQDFAQWAEETIPAVVEGLTDIAKAAKPLIDALTPIGTWFLDNKTAMTAAAVAIGAVIVAMFAAWTVSATAAAVATIAAAAPVLALVAAVALLSAGIFLLVTHWQEVTAWAEKHRTELTALGITVGILLGPFGVLIGTLILVIAHWDRVSWAVNHLVVPAFNAVVAVVNGVVVPALLGTANILNATVFPAIQGVAWAINNLLLPAVGGIGSVFGPATATIIAPFREARDWVKVLYDWVQRLIDKISSIHFPDLTPGFSLGSFNPFKQLGGSVTTGRAYIVGEGGPELFVPNASGEIIPNGGVGRVSGGGSSTVVINYQPMYSSATPAEADAFGKAVARVLRQEMA